jgi:Arc/MetJ-type ribon-helix-helix transcriptional regulator
MPETPMTITLPPRLAQEIQKYVQAGWFPDINAVIFEALHRYLESHQSELMEHFVWQDVEWGLGRQ